MEIARFSYPKAIAVILFMGAFGIWPWVALLTPVGLSVHNRYGQDTAHDWFTWVLLVLSFLFLPFAIAISRKLISEKGRAIWVADGSLYYLPMYMHGRLSFFCSWPLAEIDKFSVGSMHGAYGSITGIFVHLKNGVQDELPTHLLAESRDVVLNRLNEALTASR